LSLGNVRKSECSYNNAAFCPEEVSNKKRMYIMCYTRRFIRYTQSWNSNNLKIFWSKKIKEPKHNSQTRIIIHISDVVMQPIKIMKRKFNFNFLDRCLSFCLCFFFPTLCCLVRQFTASDYPFGIFKLFVKPWWLISSK
jgi:hypothetical protein